MLGEVLQVKARPGPNRHQQFLLQEVFSLNMGDKLS